MLSLSIIKTLSIQSLRNLASVSIELSPDINVFYGDNGSGKTSLLESVALLGLGRSFRSHKTRSLVSHEERALTVFSTIDIEYANGSSDETQNILILQRVPVGVQKSRNGLSVIKVSGETIRSAAVLAKQLPLLFINAHSFQLIEGPPLQRRKFLDWLVFHVKPEFAGLWHGLQKTLKQRNSLLRRDKINLSDIEPWNREFIRLSKAIDIVREGVFKTFIHSFKKLDSEFCLSALSVEMEYYRGWDNDQDIREVLHADFIRDCRDGYTHQGPQRSEIKIKAHSKPAVEVLSRGQEKSLVCAMTIAQAHMYHISTSRQCVFLIDDLLAELDKRNIQVLADWLIELGAQVLVTGVDKNELLSPWRSKNSTPAVFHVKHGGVKQEV
ncbi:MAG: DNA replication and repair protein RecF [Candidatus Endobugula sp.]